MNTKTTIRLFAATAAVGFALAGIANAADKPAPKPAAKPAVKAPAGPSIDGTWSVDPGHTSVSFAIKHLGLSTVRGRFNDVSGTIVADSKDLSKSSVQFTIQTASIDTDQSQRDTHLKTADFFDVAKYPTITFQSTKIAKASKNYPGYKYVAFGNLTVKAATKSVILPFNIEGPVAMPAQMGGGLRFGLETATTILRSDYGVGSDKYGPPMLGNEVPVQISLEAVTPPAKK
jgi:polyisoprenoid-binding protein YceI